MMLNTKPVFPKGKHEYIVQYDIKSASDYNFYNLVKDRTDVEIIARLSSDGLHHWILVETDNPESLLEIKSVVQVSLNRKAYAA
jgi:hypothetical protein